MYRFGARVWMSRIMVTWGIVSACTALVHDATSFYALRVLLGIAEAGFFPGIILFLSSWFPANTRSQTMGVFYFGFPLAMLFGSPGLGRVARYFEPVRHAAVAMAICGGGHRGVPWSA